MKGPRVETVANNGIGVGAMASPFYLDEAQAAVATVPVEHVSMLAYLSEQAALALPIAGLILIGVQGYRQVMEIRIVRKTGKPIKED